jgi:O-antigen/teichoic acid export membrane protein
MGTDSQNGYIRVFRSMLITAIAFIVNYGINLVLTPFITENVSTEAYGYVTMAKNFAQYAVLITTALNSFSSRYISIEYHKGNKKKASQYFNSVFFGDVFIGSAIFFVLLLFTLFINVFLNISDNVLRDVQTLFFFVFINFWLTTIFTVFGTAAYIANKLDVTGLFKALSYIAEALVLFVVFKLFPPKVFYVGVGLCVASLVVVISNFFITKRNTPDLKIQRRDFSGKCVKQLVVNGVWNSLNSLGNQLNSGLDLLVCNLLLTELAMGQLAIAKTIETIFAGLLQLVATSFQPILLRSYAAGEKNKLLYDLKFSMKIGGFLSNIAFAGFIAFGLAYYRLWIPNQDISLVYGLTVVTVLANVASGPMVPLYYIYTLTVKNRIPCIVTIIGGLANVLGMYVGIKYFGFGIYTVVWTTAIVMSIINLITNPIYMAKVLGLPLKTFYPNIVRNLISCFLLVGALNILSHILQPTSWGGLIVAILLSAIIGALIHFLVVFEKGDWNNVKHFLRKRRI